MTPPPPPLNAPLLICKKGLDFALELVAYSKKTLFHCGSTFEATLNDVCLYLHQSRQAPAPVQANKLRAVGVGRCGLLLAQRHRGRGARRVRPKFPAS
jgi:hypothetical protein